MDRNDVDLDTGLVELGIASTDTLGGLGDIIEPMGLWRKNGLSNA